MTLGHLVTDRMIERDSKCLFDLIIQWFMPKNTRKQHENSSISLVACNSNDSVSEEINTQDLKELVHEYSIGDIKNETASITSEELIITNSNESETVYSLPEDEFFVSIAPYINETHPCTNHSLTGCQGEMVEEEFDVYIEDMEGNVMLEDTLKTQANGFIDLWLPQDKTYNIIINH